MRTTQVAMCEICHFALIRFKPDIDGPTEYIHPKHAPSDHLPVPVPADLESISPVCDCCSQMAEEPIHTAISAPFDVVHPDGMYRDNGSWCLCGVCAELVKAGKWAVLRERAIRLCSPKDSASLDFIEALLRAFEARFIEVRVGR